MSFNAYTELVVSKAARRTNVFFSRVYMYTYTHNPMSEIRIALSTLNMDATGSDGATRLINAMGGDKLFRRIYGEYLKKHAKNAGQARDELFRDLEWRYIGGGSFGHVFSTSKLGGPYVVKVEYGAKSECGEWMVSDAIGAGCSASPKKFLKIYSCHSIPIGIGGGCINVYIMNFSPSLEKIMSELEGAQLAKIFSNANIQRMLEQIETVLLEVGNKCDLFYFDLKPANVHCDITSGQPEVVIIDLGSMLAEETVGTWEITSTMPPPVFSGGDGTATPKSNLLQLLTWGIGIFGVEILLIRCKMSRTDFWALFAHSGYFPNTRGKGAKAIETAMEFVEKDAGVGDDEPLHQAIHNYLKRGVASEYYGKGAGRISVPHSHCHRRRYHNHNGDYDTMDALTDADNRCSIS